jgi:hypothetical protein
MGYGPEGITASWPGLLYAVTPAPALTGIRNRAYSEGTLTSFLEALQWDEIQDAARTQLFHPRHDEIIYDIGQVLWDDADNRDVLFNMLRWDTAWTMVVPSLSHLTEGWANADPQWFAFAFARDRIPIVDADSCHRLIETAFSGERCPDTGLRKFKQGVSATHLMRSLRNRIQRDNETIRRFLARKMGEKLFNELSEGFSLGVDMRHRDVDAFHRQFRRQR